MPVLPGLVQCILPSSSESLRIDPVTFRATDNATTDPRWAGRRRIVHYCAGGKWSGPYGDLARKVLGIEYPPPPPSRISQLLQRLARRLA